MATLTTWEAEKGGYFQGRPTPGQIVDWLWEKVRKLPQLPKIEPLKGHWRTWPDGEAIGVSDAWLTKMIQDGRLPDRSQVNYLGARADKALMRAMEGTHVIVEMLDTDRRTRHRCIYLDNVLLADGDGWKKSLKKGA